MTFYTHAQLGVPFGHVISTMKLSWGEFLGSATMVMQDSFMLLAQLFFLSCHTNM